MPAATQYNIPAPYETSGYEYENFVYQYESGLLYNEPNAPYGGYSDLPVSQYRTVQWHMNRLAGTLVDDVPQLAAQGAANKWAGTSGLALVGALNAIYKERYGVSYQYDLQGILNALAGTTGLGENLAASLIES